MQISFQYNKLRSSFGRQPLFCEQGPDMCDSIVSNPLEFKSYILRNPVHQELQHGPVFSENYINTIRAEYSHSGVNHCEGGWSKEVNLHDPEATQRYRRKIEKEDSYIHCVMNLAPSMEHYINQNNAIDMYRTYYTEMQREPEPERCGVRTVNVYRDPSRRPAATVVWQPEKHRFAVCYVDVDFYRDSHVSNAAFVWNMENPNEPEATLMPSAPMFDLKFSPRDAHTLVGAIATGQVVEFDQRVGGAPVNACPPHVAHRDIARNVLFIQSKSGKEFFSSGPDGTCKWWDLRNLEEPTDVMIMDVVKTLNDVQSMAQACGVSVLEYEPTIPTRFMVGTENGLVIGGNRKGKTPMEKLPLKFDAHVGPVLSLERNPAFPKIFLTVGADWTARVWSEDCRESSILWTPPLRQRITCGGWSPSRISLLLLCGADGRLALWDLLRRQHEPIINFQLATDPLISLGFQDAGSFLTVGTKNGRVYLVEMSPSLGRSGHHDKVLMTAMFDREIRRERILEARLREIRLKHRQAGGEGTPRGSVEIDLSLGDKDLYDATIDYMQQVKKELAAM